MAGIEPAAHVLPNIHELLSGSISGVSSTISGPADKKIHCTYLYHQFGDLR